MVALQCAFCNIHLENALSPEKEMDLCMIYCNSVAYLCSKGISGQASIISVELEFVFSFEISYFGIQFLPVSEPNLINLTRYSCHLSFLSSQQIHHPNACRTGFVFWPRGDHGIQLIKTHKMTLSVAYFWRYFIFIIKRISIILISYSNTSFSKKTMFSIAWCCCWKTHYRYPININTCTLAYHYM